MGPRLPNPHVTSSATERWLDEDTLEVRHTARTAQGTLSHTVRYHRKEPSWVVERGLKDRTLLRGRPADVRREVAEILEAFRDNPRVIVGTGDQVAADTPEENLQAMLDTAR